MKISTLETFHASVIEVIQKIIITPYTGKMNVIYRGTTILTDFIKIAIKLYYICNNILLPL